MAARDASVNAIDLHGLMQEVVAQRLSELGWIVERRPALASKVFETAVGPKQAVAYLQDYGHSSSAFVLAGQYYSEGRNILEPYGHLIQRIADEDTVRLCTGQFDDDVAMAVSQSYAAKLHSAHLHLGNS